VRATALGLHTGGLILRNRLLPGCGPGEEAWKLARRLPVAPDRTFELALTQSGSGRFDGQAPCLAVALKAAAVT
jgi:hypothetical protein